jgi:uncharacterized repeat protein (TIGR03803 family)
MKTHRIFAVFVLVLLMLAATTAAAQFSELYNFGNGQGDPLNPTYEGMIAQGRDGNLYSTSPNVAASNATGTAFLFTPAGTLSVAYDFINGQVPESGLTLGTDGNFYGTTEQSNTDYGEVFKLTPNGPTVLHSFTNGDDGGGPKAPPIEGTDGNFYGTTTTGGANGRGTIYKITPSGTLTTLYAFDYTHGADAFAPLMQATDGNLYGNTFEGGSSGAGVVFKITASGKLTVLTNFSGIGGPAGPLVQASDGNFYGTTSQGGDNSAGVVFKITPSGKLTVLHSLNGSTDGTSPFAGLVLANDGNLYGVASQGGNSANCQGGCGTIFQISLKGKFSVLYNFDDTTGSYPKVTLTQHTNGTLYGDTSLGGTSKYCTTGCGTFFSLKMGLKPFAGLVFASGKVGKSVEILGQGFTGTKSVSFSGTAAKFTVVSDTYLTATVPSGATTGSVQVTTPKGTLTSNKTFRVTPQIKSFTPPSGKVGTAVTITGVSLTQTNKVTFGGVKATTFKAKSDTQVTATVPTGAKTGHIAITTLGGTAASSGIFTVTK